jgi:hypothetical protein
MHAMSDRVRLHQLVDALPERDLDTVHDVLCGLLALEDIAAGRVYSHAEARRILLGEE